MELRIDPDFESRIPPLTEDEFIQLEENILADGVIISPIIVWGDVIIDGHNRFRIAQKHPHIEFTTCERKFYDRHEALAWICKNQLGRRNLTFQQKKYLIGKQYESEKASHGGDRKSSEVKSSSQVGNLPFFRTGFRERHLLHREMPFPHCTACRSDTGEAPG